MQHRHKRDGVLIYLILIYRNKKNHTR